MTVDDELRHVRSGPNSGERPGGMALVELMADAPEHTDEVLTRVRDVMEAVLGAGGQWPHLKEWRGQLPSWFVESSPPELTQEEAEEWVTSWRALPPEEKARQAEDRAWPLADWLYWMEPGHREWRWWDGRILQPGRIQIRVEAREVPTPLGALVWLLRAAGAERVRQTNGAVR